MFMRITGKALSTTFDKAKQSTMNLQREIYIKRTKNY